MEKEMDSVLELLYRTYPGKTLVDISDYENGEHQTYKYLYEKISATASEQTEELYDLQFRFQESEREAAKLRSELEQQKMVNAKLNDTTSTLTEFVQKFMNEEIVVSNVKAMTNSDEEIIAHSDRREPLLDTVSNRPGIYGGKRPSWFTPLNVMFSKENVAKKCVQNTEHELFDKLKFWKKHSKEMKKGKINHESVAREYDKHREKKIRALLKSMCTNEEKYLKYLLLTPGVPADFLNTLMGASELGLDANVIIELLEQPKESFNKEIIEIYISQAHKGTEYNLKKELAEELIRGEWYVQAEINGRKQKFQMVPLEQLQELKNRLENICGILSDMADGEVCANLAQTSPDTYQNEEEFYEVPPEMEPSPFIEFDDSLLN